MKKYLAAALTLLLLIMPVRVFAESAAIVNEDELYEITVPETFHIITEKNIGMHQEYLKEKEIEAETLINNFKTHGITAFGYTDDRKQELFVTVLTDKSAKNVFSIDRFTQEELDVQINGFMDSSNEGAGIYPQSAEYITVNNIKYLRGTYENRQDEENIFRCAQYYTVQNGRYYMVSIYDYSGAEYDSVAEQLDGIMQNFRFTKLLQPESERQAQQNFSNLIPLIIMLALGIGIIIVVLVMRRSDKKRNKKA